MAAGQVPVTLATLGVNATDAITSAVGTSSTPITITSADPLPSVIKTGSSVTISGITGFAAANGTFPITVTGANTFTLDGTSGTVGTSDPNTGTWVVFSPSDSIASIVGTSSTPITVTSTNPLPAGLASGAQVTITNVTGFSAANKTFTITVTGANTFTLNGTTGTVGSGNANTGNWSTPSGNLASGYELGPAFLLPDGRVFQVGATNQTAIYTPPSAGNPTGSWVAGPTIPGGLGANDAPGAVLPNGRVLFAASATPAFGPTSNTINPVPVGTSLFEFDPISNTINQVTNLPSQFATALSSNAAFITRMLVLPSGQVLITDSSGQPYIYTPARDRPMRGDLSSPALPRRGAAPTS